MKFSRGAFLLIIILSIFEAAPLSSKAAAEAKNGTAVRKRYILAEGQRRIDTEISFVVPGSDSVTVDGLGLSRNTDYRINSLSGVIVLVNEAEAGQVLEFACSRYPFSFPPIFARRYPSGEAPEKAAAVVGAAGGGDAAQRGRNPYRIRVSGSKSVGFSLGTGRGVGIDQSLKVTLSGKLAKDLEVKAFLSDDNLPVQPEGNTEELKRLDRISVNIKSRHTEVRLADLTTGSDWSVFSSFERDLRGADVAVKLDDDLFFAGGGLAKGRFETMETLGREGVQGPYELLSTLRFNGAIVIPGSEAVYLNGNVMKRGGENDYTIDYSRATVTFTERVPITDDSEIVVEFQVGERNYERTTVAAGYSGSFLSGSMKLNTLFFRESDDEGSPIGGEYTSEELNALGSAGDDPDSAFASGVQTSESGGSGYIFVEADSATAGHYEFVESGAEYILDFYAFQNGDYDTDGFSSRGQLKYRYVGPGNGNYMIGRPLPLPESKNIFVLAAEARSDHLFLNAEGDVSDHDQNTLSGIDDDDNDGYALSVEGGVKGLELLSSTFALSGEYSSLDDRFSAPDRAREAYYYRNWNLEDVPLSSREEVSGLSLDWRSKDVWRAEGSYRKLKRGDGISAEMRSVKAALGDMGERGLKSEWFSTRTGNERKRDYALAEGALGLWHVLPRVSFDTERYSSFTRSSPDTGRYYYRNIFSLATRNTGPYSGELAYSERITDNMRPSGGEWFRARENSEIRFSGSYSGRTRIVDMFLSHREKDEVEYGAVSKYDLARLRYRDSWEKAGLTTDLGYRVSSGEERRLQKAVIFVGENEGDYDSEGREVGQKRGDYMVVFIPGGEKENIRNVELSWRLSLGSGVRGLGVDAGGEGGLFGVLKKNISLDHFFSISEKSTTDELIRLYTLDPALLQRDDVTLFGRNSLRQEWDFLRDVKKYNLRLLLYREDEEDNRSEGVSASRYFREVRVRAEAIPNSLFNITWEVARENKNSTSNSPSAQNYEVRSVFIANTLGYRPSPETRLSVETAYEKREDKRSQSSQVSFSGRPTANLSIGRDISFSAFYKLTFTKVEVDSGQPLFFLQEGVRQDWNLNSSYRLGRNISVGINYTGRREKDYSEEVKTIHALKVESRAYF